MKRFIKLFSLIMACTLIIPCTLPMYAQEADQDIVSTDPINPNQPDGIPDRFQQPVVFIANNGTFADGSTEKTVYVTLRDRGELAEYGQGHISMSQVPAVSEECAAPGYTLVDTCKNMGEVKAAWKPKISEATSIYKNSKPKKYNFYYVKDMESYAYTVNYHIITKEQELIKTGTATIGTVQAMIPGKYTITAKDEERGFFLPVKKEELEKILGGFSLEGYEYEYTKFNGEPFDPANFKAGMALDLEGSIDHYYVLQQYDFTVNFLDDQGNIIQEPYIQNLYHNGTYDYTLPEINGYVLESPEQTEYKGSIKKPITINAIYTKDQNNDKIPDKYQSIVSFNAYNGTVDKESAVVTLYDADGNWSEDGVGYLTKEQLPTATANKGYDQDSLTWSDASKQVTLDTKLPIYKGNPTFTASFDKKNYQLTIHYIDQDGKPLYDAMETQILFGGEFKIQSPAIKGYTLKDPNQALIQGTMNDQDTEIHVIYEKEKYKLTIEYVDEQGKPIANSYTSEIAYNEPFAVRSPEIKGYQLKDPKQANISGFMADADQTITVVYTKAKKGIPTSTKTNTNLFIGLGALALIVGGFLIFFKNKKKQ